jgi:hypothetical protein
LTTEITKMYKAILFIIGLSLHNSSYSQYIGPYAVSTCINDFSISSGSLKFSVGELAVFKFQNESGISISSGIIPSSNMIFNSISEVQCASCFFSVFPNPFTETLQIKAPLISRKIDIVLHNAIGKTILSDRFEQHASNYLLDLSFLSAGSYILEIRDSENQIQQNILIIKAI